MKQLLCLFGTTDAWTSDANVARLLLPASTRSVWEPLHLYLGTRAVPRHTDVAVAKFYSDIMFEFDIEKRRSRISADSVDETLFLHWNRKPTSGRVSVQARTRK